MIQKDSRSFSKPYLNLNKREEQIFQTKIQQFTEKEAKAVEIISSYRREGRIEGRKEGIIVGRKEGRKEGQLEGKRDSIYTIFETRFDTVPDKVRNQLQNVQDIDVLSDILKRLLAAETLDDAEDIVESVVNKRQ